MNRRGGDGTATGRARGDQDVVEATRGRLIVSCQAYPGETMRDPRTMAQVAAAAVAGGAAAIRAQGAEDIRQVVAAVDVPVIGLIKDGADGVFITPTLEHAIAVAAAGAHVVAVDGTRRPRPDGLTLAKTISGLRERTGGPGGRPGGPGLSAGVLVMADCGSLDDALAAADAGADLVGTTLAGYTGERPRTDGPDLELLEQVVASVGVAVIAEGRIHTPTQAAAALAAGAHAVCVGTAITHPTTITSWFVDALSGEA
ncbi:N-acetylmannosamine-6-phosphate 2-epimerase [Georgenia muralis]|uniref:Putative N-acetylmannosamine-6-phosphate 2-epimerase n=1 Tax=Georgenia muralis TaxID=154117 RepID=A0A3N4Z337_9MICO|nr:putative N-acetylmannosamine-6-phosphate 2-epimerase [Georgenia muralis]RPF26254.1 N-acylglucosamine-6-phosphate 2-epimerase [Georgenia muralis]